MTDLNESGRAYARSLIAAGKVDRASAWSFSAADGDALLGAGGSDWTTYSKAHLGENTGQQPKTKGRFEYPFAKGGKVYRSALIAIKQRAAAQGESAILSAATELLDKVDADSTPKSGDAAGFEVKAFAVEFKFTTDGSEPEGTFEGYASTFGNEDDGGDAMLPGAFDRTLAQAKAVGRMPKMLLNHGGLGFRGATPSPVDLLPIGRWGDMSPDSHGLQAKGRLINLDTDHGKRVYGSMKEGELSDLSIGYKARDFTRGSRPNEPRRSIKSVDLFEAGPVTFPMNRMANINDVKGGLLEALALSPYDMRDLEGALRDGGLSRTDAVKAVAAFKSFLQRDAAGPEQEPRDAATSDDVAALVARIRAASA